ncbi:hypothetical protein V6N12_059262 [Hibiscus sabdariffa]|uniref:Uncharacterized protein n=1 Tax=Hibiscus sabdariffa TaxID=183260 RepID=A0ABR2EUM0_9ROSI
MRWGLRLTCGVQGSVGDEIQSNPIQGKARQGKQGEGEAEATFNGGPLPLPLVFGHMFHQLSLRCKYQTRKSFNRQE